MLGLSAVASEIRLHKLPLKMVCKATARINGWLVRSTSVNIPSAIAAHQRLQMDPCLRSETLRSRIVTRSSVNLLHPQVVRNLTSQLRTDRHM